MDQLTKSIQEKENLNNFNGVGIDRQSSSPPPQQQHQYQQSTPEIINFKENISPVKGNHSRQYLSPIRNAYT